MTVCLTNPRIDSLQTLYTYPNNFRAYKALIAAQYSGAQVTVAPESDFKFGETNQSADYLAKFPLGKVSCCGYVDRIL